MKRCKLCAGSLSEDALGILICKNCGTGWHNGKKICRYCVEGDCSNCESWRDGTCSHECFLQSYHGSVEDIGFIIAGEY